MIHPIVRSPHTSARSLPLDTKIPTHPEIVRRFKIPAIPFMMFHGPPHVTIPWEGSTPWMP